MAILRGLLTWRGRGGSHRQPINRNHRTFSLPVACIMYSSGSQTSITLRVVKTQNARPPPQPCQNCWFSRSGVGQRLCITSSWLMLVLLFQNIYHTRRQNQRWLLLLINHLCPKIPHPGHPLPMWVVTAICGQMWVTNVQKLRTQFWLLEHSKGTQDTQCKIRVAATASGNNILHLALHDTAQRVHCSVSRAALFRENLNLTLLPICNSLLR